MARKINLNWNSENLENCWVPQYSQLVPELNKLIKVVSIGSIRELVIQSEECFVTRDGVPLKWHVFQDCEMLGIAYKKIAYEFTRGIPLCKKCQQYMDVLAASTVLQT